MSEALPPTLQSLYFPLLLGTVALVLVLEWLSPLQRRDASLRQRWTTNLGLYGISYLVPLLLLPAGILVYSHNMPERGLSRAGLDLWLSIPATVLLLDFWRYLEHRLFHRVSLLWHMHLVHHSDTRMDVTTAERHHPLEAVLALLSLLAFIQVLAPPLEGVVAYALLALVVSLWAHANIELPPSLDALLRSVLVTPSVHALHHSDQVAETDSNYGTIFTLWDRALRTFTRPDRNREVRFGLEYFHHESDRGLWRTLLQPLLYHPGMTYSPRIDKPQNYNAGEVELTALWKSALLVLLSCSALLMLVYGSTVQTLIRTWLGMADWGYALLVVPTFLYLALGEYREELLASRPRRSWAGLLPALAGALIMLGGEILDINLFRQLALVVALQAIIVATLGTELYRRYIALWWLPFLMVPYGDLATPLLRHATLWSVEVVSSLAALPFEAQGYRLTVAGNSYTIVTACAGTNYFTLAVFLSYSLALVLYRQLLPVLAITTIAALVAVLANFVRVNTIVLLDISNGTQASLEAHSPFYWLAFALMFAVMFFLLTRLQPQAPTITASAALPTEGSGTYFGWRQTTAATALCVLPLLFNQTGEQRLETPPTFTPPAALAGYTQLSGPSSWRPREDGETTFSTARYNNGTSEMTVIAEFPLYRRVKLDSWGVLPDQVHEWTPERRDLREASREACRDCASYLHHTWVQEGTDELYNVYASYVDHQQLITSQLKLRLQRGLFKLRGASDQPFGIIAFISNEPIRDGATVTAILEQLQAALD